MKKDDAVGGIESGERARHTDCCGRVPDSGCNATDVATMANIDEPEIDVRNGQAAGAGLSSDIDDIMTAVGESSHTGFGHGRATTRLRCNIVEDGYAHGEQAADVSRRIGG